MNDYAPRVDLGESRLACSKTSTTSSTIAIAQPTATQESGKGLAAEGDVGALAGVAVMSAAVPRRLARNLSIDVRAGDDLWPRT